MSKCSAFKNSAAFMMYMIKMPKIDKLLYGSCSMESSGCMQVSRESKDCLPLRAHFCLVALLKPLCSRYIWNKILLSIRSE